MAANEIEIADLRRLARSDAPDFADAVIAFLAQPDPAPPEPLPADAQRFPALLQELHRLQRRRAAQRREATRALWTRYLAQREPGLLPPRLELAELLVETYERGTDAGRRSLLDIALRARLRYGLWAGLKQIYKRAEERLDARFFGVLAWRFDAEVASLRPGTEVQRGTLVYLRRRAWRFLRLLGQSVPELYPRFAVEVLRHYPVGTVFAKTLLASHLWAHGTGRYTGRGFVLPDLPANLVEHRAFDEAWKRSPDPLLDLLETCQVDAPARFAVQSLRRDFPDALRHLAPARLARLAYRPLGSVHAFLVEVLQTSPEFHPGRLRALGLHDPVLALLVSQDPTARAYAIEYARAHAQDLAPTRLAELVACGLTDTVAFAVAMLQNLPPRALGHAFLGQMLAHHATTAWAAKSLQEGFERKELPEDFFTEMLIGSWNQSTWATQYLQTRYQPGELPPSFWTRVLDDPRARNHYATVQTALAALAKYPVETIGTGWLLDAITRPDLAPTVGVWLERAQALPGLDVERLKGFVFNPAYRAIALSLLGNTRLVSARELTLPWLLALARRADPSLHDFAHRYLLEHMKPEDFADTDHPGAGIERLFTLATGDKEPEPVRVFAQTYLRCHHPVIGPDQPEARALRLEAQLPRAVYTAARVWPGLADPRADVRRFAVAITRAELRAWACHTRVYELAESDAKDVRNIAYDALLRAGTPGADRARTLDPDELDPDRVFALAQSRLRSTREVGMEVIRGHYARLGGPDRLAWLMASPDREVRLFAVHMLWERHRPRSVAAAWKPAGANTPPLDPAAPFTDVLALRDFLRRVLYGIPPGRMERRDDTGPRRHLPASVAKRHVIEVVRDLGVRDAAFAQLVAPILTELTASFARGEWQAALAALSRLRAAHPGADLGGLPAAPPPAGD